MRFKYLTEIGESYDSEVGTSGHRNDLRVWQRIETKLKQAIVDLRAAQQNPSQAAAVSAAQAKVDHLRNWLRMEGAEADANGNFDVSKLQPKVVGYDDNRQRQGLTKVEVRGGRLFSGNQPLDTTNMVTHFSGPGKGIFVLSWSGDLHVGSHVVGNYHHS